MDDATTAKQVSRLINATADDCLAKLRVCTVDDLPMLRDALQETERREHLTRAGYIRSRIHQLQKELRERAR